MGNDEFWESYIFSSFALWGVNLTEVEAAIFFGLALMPWLAWLYVKFESNLLFFFLLSPFAYWLVQSGFESFGFISVILFVPGWPAGVELLLSDYLDLSMVDLLNIERCPCERKSWWRIVLWVLIDILIAIPALGLIHERTQGRHQR